MKFFICLFLYAITMSFFGCVKDTDFDQLDAVVFTPEIELDLIYFDLDAGEFFDEITNTARFTVRDTTALDFLFDFNNAIPRTFEVDFEFLRMDNSATYTTGTVVQPGTTDSPTNTLFTKVVEGEDLNSIERA
jgi:hypothetical protein